MSIKHCIIHGISLASETEQIKLHLREEENPHDGPAVSLFIQLKQSLQKSATRQYGLFDPEQSDNPLPGWLAKYQQQEMGFLSVSKKMTEQLKLDLSEHKEPFSAHLLFVVEELMEHQYLYVFWVSHTDAQYIDTNLSVENLQYVSGNKINYVMKMDFSQWAVKDWQQYMTVQTSRGNNDLAHGFMKFTSFIAGVNLQKQTDEFLNIVDQYAHTLDREESNATKNTIVDYCVDQDMNGNPINFDSLSQVLNENEPEKFSSFISENLETPTEEIYAHRNSLKKYVRFYGREKDLSISFSSDRMDDNISFDPATGSLTFSQVPKSLQAQLAKYLTKQ
ncbi:MAG: nucleoid-associated protein [Kangiellaceae bacterium]|nr:nucleoid-associated protein [Kangiellaceae bacterium]